MSKELKKRVREGDGQEATRASSVKRRATQLIYHEGNSSVTWSSQIRHVPFRLLVATAKDFYRKPLPGMWYAIKELHKEDGIDLNPENIIFVGNAGRVGDHSDSDRKFADNIKMKFCTPEEFFYGKAVELEESMAGFHPRSLPIDGPLYYPSSKPLMPQSRGRPVLMIVFGWPSIGKTSAYKKYFQPAGFIRVNERELRGRSKCMDAIEDAIKSKKSVVIDDINEGLATRRDYVDLAKVQKVSIHCIYFEGDRALAKHNDLYRVHCMKGTANRPRQLLPSKVYEDYEASFTMPTKDEGFKDIKHLYWKFDGTGEDLERYIMWLDLDGCET